MAEKTATLQKIIRHKTNNWIKYEKDNSLSIIYPLLKHIEADGYLRQPQREAIEIYLWFKFKADNCSIEESIKKGLFYDESLNKETPSFLIDDKNWVSAFLWQFANDNGLSKLKENIILNHRNKKWELFLKDLFHNFNYPNYLYSLPMGAGKTYLIACFIYLDLYFSDLLPNDRRFAENFIVLAPHSKKTAILPSLKTIKDFNPERLFEKSVAGKLKNMVHIEILDALSSAVKDKLQSRSPNLEKLNRLMQTKNKGLVFITNAEKVVLERYSDENKYKSVSGECKISNTY